MIPPRKRFVTPSEKIGGYSGTVNTKAAESSVLPHSHLSRCRHTKLYFLFHFLSTLFSNFFYFVKCWILEILNFALFYANIFERIISARKKILNKIKNAVKTHSVFWLGWQDSNLRMRESKSRVLPLDDSPL